MKGQIREAASMQNLSSTKMLVSFKSAAHRSRSQHEGLSLSETWLPALRNQQFSPPTMSFESADS